MGKTIDISGNTVNEQPKQQVTVNMADSVEIKCVECGGTVFVSGVKFRKISKLLTGTPQDAVIPIEVYLCGNCGEVNNELYLEVLRGMGINTGE